VWAQLLYGTAISCRVSTDSDLRRGTSFHRHFAKCARPPTPQPHLLTLFARTGSKHGSNTTTSSPTSSRSASRLPHPLRILYTLGIVVNYFLQRAPALTDRGSTGLKNLSALDTLTNSSRAKLTKTDHPRPPRPSNRRSAHAAAHLAFRLPG